MSKPIVLDKSKLLGFRICDQRQESGDGAPAPIGSKIGKNTQPNRRGVPSQIGSKVGKVDRKPSQSA